MSLPRLQISLRSTRHIFRSKADKSVYCTRQTGKQNIVRGLR